MRPGNASSAAADSFFAWRVSARPAPDGRYFRSDAGRFIQPIRAVGLPPTVRSLRTGSLPNLNLGGCFRSARALMIGGWDRRPDKTGHGTQARPHRQSGRDRDPHRAERGGARSRLGRGLLRGRRGIPARVAGGRGGGPARAGRRGLPRPGSRPRSGGALGLRRHPPGVRLLERERGVRAALRGSRHPPSSDRTRRRWSSSGTSPGRERSRSGAGRRFCQGPRWRAAW